MGVWLPLRACELTVSDAQFNMGLLSSGAFDNPPDLVNAAGWFQKAADQGHVAAQYNLGVLYLEGKFQ